MTQVEYEKRLTELSEAQRMATMPERLHVRAIEQKQLETYAQIDELRARLARLSIERHKAENRLREINADFHERRHALVMQRPDAQAEKLPY